MERCKVTGSKECLESVGIDYDITGLEGMIKGYYDSGYVQVEITHIDLGLEFTNDFDIPSYWIKKLPMIDEFEIKCLQTIHNVIDMSTDKEAEDLYESLNKGRDNNGLDPIELTLLSRTEILEISQKDIDNLKSRIPKKEKKKKPNLSVWMKENFEKDEDHNYYTSISERVEDGMAPGDLSRYTKKDILREYKKLK